MGGRPQPPGPDPTVRTARSTRDPHLRPGRGHHLGQQVTPGDVHDHGTGDYRRNPATEAIHHPGHDEHPDRRRHRTADRADGADQPAEKDRHPPATLVRQWSTEQLTQPHPQEEGGQYPSATPTWPGRPSPAGRPGCTCPSRTAGQRSAEPASSPTPWTPPHPRQPPAADREWERSHRQATSGSRKDHDLPGRANPLQVVVRVGAPVDFEDPVQRDQLRVRSRRRKVVRHRRGRQIRTFRGLCRDPHRLFRQFQEVSGLSR